MYIIIAGCGKVASNLALLLSQKDQDVVVIDSDPKNFELLGSGFNGVTIAGVPIDEDVLRSAGIEQADALVAATNSDNMNFMVSQIAHKIFDVPIVITRLYDPERDTVFSKMGLTTVCPTTLAVEKLKDMLLQQNDHTTLSIGRVNIPLRLFKPTRQFIGKHLADLNGINIFGIIRDGGFLSLDSKTVIKPTDMLIVSEYMGQGGDVK